MERFWSKVNKGAPNECWLWTSGLNDAGYGQFSIGNRPERAHRLAWKLVCGEIPTGQCVLHRCDVRRCVNPAHLFLGTRGDNAKDRDRKGRGNNPRGERQGSAKLTESDVQHIRIWHRNGFSQSEIGRSYGVSKQSIASIANLKLWTHVPDLVFS